MIHGPSLDRPQKIPPQVSGWAFSSYLTNEAKLSFCTLLAAAKIAFAVSRLGFPLPNFAAWGSSSAFTRWEQPWEPVPAQRMCFPRRSILGLLAGGLVPGQMSGRLAIAR